MIQLGRGEFVVLLVAQGHSVWEGEFEMNADVHEAVIELTAGQHVRGRLNLPKNAEDVVVKLEPHDPGIFRHLPHEHKDFMNTETIVDDDGTFAFKHVAPRDYLMQIRAETITPHEQSIIVTDTALDVGSISIFGTGILRAQLFDPDSGGTMPWIFAAGFVGNVAFLTDEHGKIDLPNVPIGDHTLTVYQFNASRGRNIEELLEHSVIIREGKPTELDLWKK